MDIIFITLPVFILGLAAGIIGALTRSGGLLGLPGLIIMGLPPQMAIAAMRFGTVAMWLTALPKFKKADKIVWRQVPLQAAIAVIAGFIGTFTVIEIPEEILKTIIGIVVLAILAFMLIKKDIGVQKHAPSKQKKRIGWALYILAALYGGSIGAGFGAMMVFIMTGFFGLTMIEAKATDAIPWMLLCTVSLIIFLTNGLVNFTYAIPLTVGMGLGGHLGAKIALKKGDAWVKRIFVATVGIMGIKLLIG